jgi:hypothetical protein
MSLAITDVTIKIPDPIMEPATKLVASINPKERFNSVLFSDIRYYMCDNRFTAINISQ